MNIERCARSRASRISGPSKRKGRLEGKGVIFVSQKCWHSEKRVWGLATRSLKFNELKQLLKRSGVSVRILDASVKNVIQKIVCMQLSTAKRTLRL